MANVCDYGVRTASRGDTVHFVTFRIVLKLILRGQHTSCASAASMGKRLASAPSCMNEEAVVTVTPKQVHCMQMQLQPLLMWVFHLHTRQGVQV